jgi:addiction module RelE/StbE family toxin
MTDGAPQSRNVIWSDRSRRDLENIRAYIGQFKPLAAQRFTARLVTTVEGLADFPHQGRVVDRDLRELTTASPYLVRYRVTQEEVQVVWIRHGARRT